MLIVENLIISLIPGILILTVRNILCFEDSDPGFIRNVSQLQG
jgi:hypothetical protein